MPSRTTILKTLKPFADIACCIPLGVKDSAPLMLMGHTLGDGLPAHITAGDLRRAAILYDKLVSGAE